MPDLLATKRGRLATFFLLYVTEGIPLGFAATAVATQMRRDGVPPDRIGAFVASFYFPWAWKWAAGPVVDLFYSDGLGRRRAWIVGCQAMMAVTLLAAMPVGFSAQLGLFTAVLLVHNCFAAVQDVAIDALAVGTLRDEERGLANGLMFAGANVGQMVGGAGVLLLVKFVPGFNYTFFFVAGCILAVTFAVTLRIREPPTRPTREAAGARAEPPGDVLDYRSGDEAMPEEPLAQLRVELKGYLVTAFRSILGGRVAVAALVLALLPAGAYALNLALQSNLAVELGLNDDRVGYLSAASTVAGAVGCVCGGWLSDRLGRRKALALYVVLMALPTVALAWTMHRHGWVMPVDPRMPDRPTPATLLLKVFWWATIVYSLFNGLMYGARSALYMDISNPAVAATQFTAYMAMMNLVISYSALWQGKAVVRWGYPVTLAADAAFGLVCLLALPWTLGTPFAKQARAAEGVGAAPRHA
jgi:PAT family beta-lactamase induction signal transducer AmpG